MNKIILKYLIITFPFLYLMQSCVYKIENKEITKISLDKDGKDKNIILYTNSIDTVKKYSINYFHLDLSYKDLKVLPADIYSCKNIITLNLSGNDLRIFPSLSSLSNLDTLYISHNKIETVLEKDLPKNIKYLELIHNPIISLNGLCGINSLEYLSTGFSQIKSIPDCLFTSSSNLKHIELFFIEIDRLSLNICTLKNIEIIKISETNIDSLPECLCNIKTLKKIEFLNNVNSQSNIHDIAKCLSGCDVIYSDSEVNEGIISSKRGKLTN